MFYPWLILISNVGSMFYPLIDLDIQCWINVFSLDWTWYPMWDQCFIPWLILISNVGSMFYPLIDLDIQCGINVFYPWLILISNVESMFYPLIDLDIQCWINVLSLDWSWYPMLDQCFIPWLILISNVGSMLYPLIVILAQSITPLIRIRCMLAQDSKLKNSDFGSIC